MKRIAIAAAALSLCSSPALAQLYDTFDSEAGGATVLNYTNFANFDVPVGSVDLLGTPNRFGVTCFGGSGSCVDLDGLTGDAGTLVTRKSFAFTSGDLVKLSFQLSGNRRGGGTNDFFAGFLFDDVTALDHFTYGGGFGNYDYGPDRGTNISVESSIEGDQPFTPFTVSFLTRSSSSLRVYLGSYNDNNAGPILDNFSLSISPAPEPATWALMIIGFGAIGAAMRRRVKLATSGHDPALAPLDHRLAKRPGVHSAG